MVVCGGDDCARQCVRQRTGVLIVARKTDMSTAARGDDVRTIATCSRPVAIE